MTGTISRTFDGLDNILTETTPQGSVSYSYDAARRRTGITVGGQTAESYSYDNANRLTAITQGSSTVSFGYDNANRRTSLTVPNGVTMSYSYDNGSELTGISYTLGQTNLGNLTYAYDLAGRRTSMGGSLAAVNVPSAISTTAYDAANELTQWGTATPTYDANGNTLSDGTNTYVWNARNQLASINLTGETFQYDPFGRRVSKTILGTTTNYLYDGANPVQELSGTTLTANMLTGGVDEYFTRTDSTGTANFLTDALGSTLELTNSSGSTIASYTYEPFGNTTTTGSSTNTYEYTGRENDGTGVYSYRERYDSPTLGRFLSEDPIEFAGGFNLYAYVENNPVGLVDPFGLCWIYVQHTGEIDSDQMGSEIPVYVGSGYSGSGQGLNNSAEQFVPNVGPIPQGSYQIGPEQNNQICVHCGPNGSPKFLPNSMRLTPDPNNDMEGRWGFLVHGGNFVKKNSSKGCIVLPLDVRNKIANSSDNCLEVVP